jgi:altronate dehydratase small subunit
MKRAIRMNPADNVCTALADCQAGDTVQVVSEAQETVQEVKVSRAIPFGHKLALNRIGKGESIVKYGEVIGGATESIEKGDHVHIHNVDSTRIPIPQKVREREG